MREGVSFGHDEFEVPGGDHREGVKQASSWLHRPGVKERVRGCGHQYLDRIVEVGGCPGTGCRVRGEPCQNPEGHCFKREAEEEDPTQETGREQQENSS